jgi:hypothetical protein
MVKGDKPMSHVGIISMLIETKSLGKGCLAYLITISEDNLKREIIDVAVVSYYAYVFPDELRQIVKWNSKSA